MNKNMTDRPIPYLHNDLPIPYKLAIPLAPVSEPQIVVSGRRRARNVARA